MIDEKKLIEDLKAKIYPERFGERCNAMDVISGVLQVIFEQPKTDWIPCEERLPHTEMPVWTTHENGQVIEHYWYRGEFVNNYPLEPRPYPKVIAWMPKEIPQPYKKEGAENE